MKAKRFLLMLLVMLGSVTGAWAGEVDYTIIDHSPVSFGYIDFLKNGGSMIAFEKTACYVITVETKPSISLESYILTISTSLSAYVDVYASNDKSSWDHLTTGKYKFGDTPLRITVDCETQYSYYRFEFSGITGTTLKISRLQIYSSILYGEGVADNPYYISDSKNLQQFYEKCATNSSAYGKLTEDIDMSNETWNPEGDFSYTGTLDGNNHVISNLTSSVGLFRTTGAATIKNLTIENATLTAPGENCGVFTSQANGTNFQNCAVRGTISANSANAGGLVGNAVGCSFTDCQVNGPNITGTTVGGLAGNAVECTFNECQVNGLNITGTTVGGLAGNAVECTFNECQVNGLNITGTTVGGLAGVSTNNTTFSKCYSIGDYSVGIANAGALVGYAEGSTMFNQCFAATNLDNDGGEHLPVCGGGNATLNNSYYYGTGSETAVNKSDVGSGRLAYLLNNGNITGPYFQRIGTDAYPSLTMKENDYVYLALDDATYVNVCPHRYLTIYPYKAPTCFGAEGNLEYSKCNNSLCEMYFFKSDRNTATPNKGNFFLSNKAVNIQDHLWGNEGFWNYSSYKNKNDTTYHKVMEVSVPCNFMNSGNYEFSYTSMDDDPTMKLHLFFDANMQLGSFSVRFYVNGIERPAFRKDYPSSISEQHEIVTVDGLHKFDRVFVVLNYVHVEPNTGENAHLFVGTEKEELQIHNLHKHELSYNCIDGGHKEYYQCDYCESLLTQNTRWDDNNVTTWGNLVLAPLGEHNFGSANPDTQKEGNLYGVQCQNEHCTAFDPDHYVLRNYHNDTDLPLSYDGDTYSTTTPVSLNDAKAYVTPVPFAVESMEYTRTFYANVWNPWFVPFTTTVEELAENGVTDVACIESIHNYDMDKDGVVDKTVLEVILKKAGTMKAGVPYLVKAAEEYAYPMTFTDRVMGASTDVKSLHSETISAAYDFIGTYSGLTAEEVSAASIFSLNSEGAMVHRTGKILPQRWYMKEVGKDNMYEDLSPAMTRAISIRVIGEEDSTTGIRIIYTEDKQTEELLPEGIFDLSGRKLTVPQHGKISIVNGKKQLAK